MRTYLEHDDEEVLRQLGELYAARKAELAREDPGDSARGSFGPLSEVESRALIAAALARAKSPPLKRGARFASRSTPTLKGRRFFALALVAAATVALLLVRPSALPEYDLYAPRSDAMFRSTQNGAPSEGADDPRGEPARYDVGRELRFLLRPARSFDGPLHVAVYSERDISEALSFTQVERVPDGGVAVTLRTGPSGYEPRSGADTLIFALAADAPPLSEDIERGVSNSRLRLFRLPVVWQRPEPYRASATIARPPAASARSPAAALTARTKPTSSSAPVSSSARSWTFGAVPPPVSSGRAPR